MTTNELNSLIGDRLKAARTRRGWSREALAFHSGLSWSAIAQIESGRRTNVRPTTLSALSDALTVTVDYLLGRDGRAHAMFEHHALLYDTDDEFADSAAGFLAAGLERSEAALAVTSSAKLILLRNELGALASGVELANAAGWYTTPPEALARYRNFVDQQLANGAGWIHIVGEPIWSGKSADEVLLWTRYESLLNLEFAGLPVTLICPYDTAALDATIIEQARVTHQHTRAHGDVVPNPEYKAPSDFALGP